MLTLQAKWAFQRMAAEVNGAQVVIVDHMKDKIRENGAFITIDEIRPNRHMGSKEERMEAVLKPLYENQKIWHYEAPIIKTLENELTMEYPDHDDIKDTLSVACANITPPSRSATNSGFKRNNMKQYKTHPFFGGVMRSRNVR